MENEKCRWVVDTVNHITSIHHFSSEIPLQDQQIDFRKKMLERYKHTDQRIKNSKEVALLGTWNVDMEELIVFLSEFGNLYPSTNFTMINVRNNETAKGITERYRVINERLKISEYEFSDINPIHRVGGYACCNEKWDQIVGRLTLKNHPFIEKIKGIMEKRPFLFIYGAGVYGEAAVRYFKKYALHIESVLVTDASNNPESVLDILVKEPCEVEEYMDKSMVVIAVMGENNNKDIRKALLCHGKPYIIEYDQTPFFYGN